jgi:hypothetical protein
MAVLKLHCSMNICRYQKINRKSNEQRKMVWFCRISVDKHNAAKLLQYLLKVKSEVLRLLTLKIIVLNVEE